MLLSFANRLAFQLREPSQISAHDLVLEDGAWRAIGAEPYLVYKLGVETFVGAWMLNLHVESVAGPLKPRIHVYRQNGATELAAQFMRQITWNHYKLALMLLGHSPLLRLDPVSSECTFRVISFTATPVRMGTFFARASRNGENRTSKRVESVASLKKTIADLWRRGVAFEIGEVPAKTARAFSYQAWIDEFEEPSAVAEEKCRRLQDRPVISILMRVFNNTTEDMLEAAIQSVVGQIYDRWELCIADDASEEPLIRSLIERWQQRDTRIKAVFRERNGLISEANNSAFALAQGEWIALLHHNDLLAVNALAEVALAIEAHPDAEVIYSDEDKLDEGGRRYGPYFKPDWSYDLFTGQNYLNHLTVVRAENVRRGGGWRVGFEGGQDYDLLLRIVEKIDQSRIIHIPKVLYHRRAAEGSASVSETAKAYAYDAGRRALVEHVARTGIEAAVLPVANGKPAQYYRLKREITKKPLVSLIIPTRDRPDMLKACVGSILGKTEYSNYEVIIVDNDSAERATLEYFSDLTKFKNVRVVHYARPFNFSGMNNFAANLAKGDIIGLINNDIEVINADWLTEMVSHVVRPEIGCVGAKLYYPNDTLQHGGIILGIGGVAGHSHKNAPRGSMGYYGRLALVQNLSAVTAACLLVRKEVYLAAGGFDEHNLAVAFNDVDFCLRVKEQGYLNLWTPFAELYHRESMSRGSDSVPGTVKRFRSEISFMKQRWKADLSNDRYYSPNLTLDREDFSLAVKRR